MRIGIIGAGRIANSVYFPMLAHRENTAVCIMSKHRENAESACKKYSFDASAATLEQMLSWAPDMVILLTPKQVRSIYLDILLEKGIPVYCEKPLAMTLEECRHIVGLAAKTGTPMTVGFNRRWAVPVVEARNAFGHNSPELVVCEKYKEQLDYRATLENAIHMVDTMRFLCGECRSVEAQARIATDPMHESLCTAQLSFENESVGLLSTSRCAGTWFERIAMIGKDENNHHITCEIIMPDRLTIWSDGHLERENHYTATDAGFQQGLESFIQCLKDKKKPANSVEDAYRTHLLLHEILHKAKLPDLNTQI